MEKLWINNIMHVWGSFALGFKPFKESANIWWYMVRPLVGQSAVYSMNTRQIINFKLKIFRVPIFPWFHIVGKVPEVAGLASSSHFYWDRQWHLKCTGELYIQHHFSSLISSALAGVCQMPWFARKRAHGEILSETQLVVILSFFFTQYANTNSLCVSSCKGEQSFCTRNVARCSRIFFKKKRSTIRHRQFKNPCTSANKCGFCLYP